MYLFVDTFDLDKPQADASSPPRYYRRAKSCIEARSSSYDPYMSIYRKDFTGESPPRLPQARPKTSILFASNRKIKSNYQDEFQAKPTKRVEPIRTGTSSGCRRNNPHPLQAFLTWKLTSGGYDKLVQSYKNPLDRQKLESILRSQRKSTYQVDYTATGIQNGVRVKQCRDGNLKPQYQKHFPDYSFSTYRRAYGHPGTRAEPAVLDVRKKTTKYNCWCSV